MAAKCAKDAEHVYVPLVMVSIGGRKRTHASKTVYQNASIDTNFDRPIFSLDSTFKDFWFQTLVHYLARRLRNRRKIKLIVLQFDTLLLMFFQLRIFAEYELLMF
jgi:hypothetical protein